MSDEPTLILHTPMPLMPLTQMVAGMGEIIIDTTGLGSNCCFYGWGESIEGADCKPHHLVVPHKGDNVTLKWMATTLAAMGIEVVVTDYADWSIVSSIMPMLYHDEHDH